jgi:two-component system sensor histidine kinase HydH
MAVTGLRTDYRNLKFLIIALLVLVLVGLHYLVPQDFSKFHIFLNMVHFVPLILAGFWFGIRGALIVWGSITLIYSPYLWLHLYSNTGELYEQILYSLLFLSVALLLGFLSDRQKQIQKEKQQMTRLAAMGEAISFISNEMKAPLVTIGGFTRQVRDDVNTKKLQEKMDLVSKEVTRMEHLIKNMLDFAGPARVSLSPANLIPIVEEVIPVIQDHSVNKEVKLDVDYPERLPAVNCDAAKMKEVFLNLAFNAIEASPECGAVRIQLRGEDDCIISEISDEREGVDEGDLNDIFSPFFTTKGEGTGLGLAITKKIVEAHQGEINIQKNQPRGILVRVKLPIE